ncbi:MAG: hypothetical protein HF314_09375 [Ignavibacteria bacterium]|jgi:hypothetical protein|nr:hypothetical protein [Ignavibacteria bacterium]MCU7503273.1 hypothetical protein [Ignavibacteria bacterium]MCU7515781.1 hypothetical protein [Ignavibacteria bacterium]
MNSYYKEILNRFDKLSKREYASLSLTGLAFTLILVVSLFTVLAILEAAGNFSSAVRTTFFLVMLIASFGSFVYLFLYPFSRYFNLFSRPDYNEAARKVGSFFPSIRDELLNAMQLVELKNNGGGRYYSQNLADAAFQQVYLKTQSVNFNEAISFARAKKMFRYLSGVVLLAALLFAGLSPLRAASYRILNFGSEFIPPARFTFEIKPGDSQLTKGEDVKIRIKVFGPKPGNVTLSMKYAEQAEFEQRDLHADSAGVYYFEVPAVRSSFSYFVSAEEVQSREFKITVVDKPIIRSLDVVVTPPAYSGQQSIEQQDNGNITSLLGSQIKFSVLSTKELKSAKLVFTDSTEARLSVYGRNALGYYRIKKDVGYSIELTDIDGHKNENPISFTIKALPDNYPTIEFYAPNKDVTLAEDDRVPLVLKISDDFGFTRLVIHYRLSASKVQKPTDEFSSLEIPVRRGEKEQDVNYIWNLSPLRLKEQDVITYYIEVYDNDNVSGPKSAKTGVFNVRVPSLDELFRQADNTQQSAEKKLSETLTEAQKLKENLEKMSQDLKQDKKDITWQEKEKIDKALQKFDELEHKVDDIRKDMAKMQNDMQQNNLLSKETLQKYMELQDLFNRLSSDEMKKAMERLQQALQQMNRDNVQQSMEQMKFDEDQFKKSIERTLKLLKRTQVEQKMDEILKRTEDLNKQADELKQETSKSNLNDSSQKQNLANKQKEVSKDLKDLEKKMDELQERMKEFEDMPKDKMKKAQEEFEKQQNEKLSEQASEELMQGQKQQAQQKQSNISQNMSKMKQRMQQMQQQMQQQNQRQAFNEMRKILDNLLTLSKEQEALKNQTQRMDPNSQQLSENARKQSNLQSGMEQIMSQIGKLSQKTFAISPELGQALGKAQQGMRQSLSELQMRNGASASEKQKGTMSALNQSAEILKRSMENMLNGQGEGSGMMSMMQQLQKLSQQQMNLNNMTQQMNKGSLSLQQQAQMQRLAQQQDMIRKSLEQLNRENKMSGQSKKLPANMDNVLKEMQEVVSEMKTQKLNDDVVQKQERILSKLLDAQRSINDRDFEKDRESNSGKEIAHQSAAELNLQRTHSRIKDELMRAVQEGYSKDYENLIRKYYEALQRDSSR